MFSNYTITCIYMNVNAVNSSLICAAASSHNVFASVMFHLLLQQAEIDLEGKFFFNFYLTRFAPLRSSFSRKT